MISALIYRNAARMKANELMMIGELITAEEALELHIVNRVVPAAEFDADVARLAAPGRRQVAAADDAWEGQP